MKKTKLLLLLLTIIFTSCTNYKLSDDEKKQRRKDIKEKSVVLGAMAIYAITTKIIADKQTVIK